jgi:hypothetical protein
MRKAAFHALRTVAAVVAIAVALPLGSWAAARTPIAARPSFGSFASKSTLVFCAHRRVRRQRRDFSAYHGNWSRAIASSFSVPEPRHASWFQAVAAAEPVADTPPPDLPPA